MKELKFIKKKVFIRILILHLSDMDEDKDIYTVVPGLGTLYVVKDGTSGTYQIHTEELDDRTEDYIETVAVHKDVQVMMEESRKEYQKAVQSDALLREALSDLKQAYESSADSLE